VSNSFSQDQYFKFQTKKIEISDNGNLIEANIGKAISLDKNFEINADYFKYNNLTKILEIKGDGIIFFKSDNLKIIFNEGMFDQKKSLFEVYGKIKTENLNNDLDIDSEKIIYNFKEKILYSLNKTLIEYNYQNRVGADAFEFRINENLLKIKNLDLIDKNKTNFRSSIAYINTNTNNLYGKDIFINLYDKSLNKNIEPRLKGNSVINNDSFTTITKGVFTSCKKRDGCPPWELSSKKIIHDKKKRTINYENAFLKIYDKPIAYFPRFSHPDPTVSRKSGFLTPSIKNSSNQKNYFSIPYYFVVSDSRDMTFSPRFYDHEELFLQTEYRQVGDKSYHISDFSFKLDDFKKLKSHFFYQYNKNFNLENFTENNFDLKIQTTSKDTYIKKNKIRSNIIKNENILENSVKLDFSTNDTYTNIEAISYEDLNKEETDRFEFIMPKIDFVKKLDNKTNLNGDFTFKSRALGKNYDTNVIETININNLIFESFPRITKKGFYNNYEFFIKNTNTNAQNSTSFKNKENIFLSGLFQFNSSLPLIKEDEAYKKITTPKMSIKIAPNYTKNNRDDDIKIDVNNIYSLNRSVKEDMIEGGLSLTYGNEFSILNKAKNSEMFNFKIANNLRIEENDDLPRNSQIGQKTSSILSSISYQPIENIKLSYNSSIKNNLSDINYENFISEFKINNIVTNFDYSNQNNSSNATYISNNTEFILDNENKLKFSTRRNKTLNLTEYYNLAYQYNNDCLTASLQYNKEYYNDRDLRPNESVSIKLTIIPFENNQNGNF
tara:strand:- start:1083 stop:3419 length:2337 start_codon:yes stop_codon:yes gene_type:complete